MHTSGNCPPPNPAFGPPDQTPMFGLRPHTKFLRERRPMATALVLSFLMHALMMSLTFNNQGIGLPGLSLPWRERRFEPGDLGVALVPAQGTTTSSTLIAPSEIPLPTGKTQPKPIAVPGTSTMITYSPVAEADRLAPPSAPAPALTESKLARESQARGNQARSGSAKGRDRIARVNTRGKTSRDWPST